MSRAAPKATQQPPTVQQRLFAQHLALGQPQAKAYRAAHPNVKMNAQSLSTAAGRSAKSKAVQKELARLMADPLLQPVILEPCAAARDPQQLREHAVAIMLRLSRHPEAQVAFAAASWLAAFADATDPKLRPAPAEPPDRERLMRDLRGLYAKALKRPPLVAEVVEATAEPAPGDAPANSVDSVDSADPVNSAPDPQDPPA
jgi:hypothetical protein